MFRLIDAASVGLYLNAFCLILNLVSYINGFHDATQLRCCFGKSPGIVKGDGLVKKGRSTVTFRALVIAP